MNTVKQGRILRDTSVRDGLVLVEKQQYLFRLEGMWKGDVAPKVNMLVEAEFSEKGLLVGLRPSSAPDAAADQATRVLSAAKETAERIADDVQTDGVPMLLRRAQEIGYPTLAAVAALLLGWFYFAAASMNLGSGGNLSFTFYQVLKFLNIQGPQDLLNMVNGGGAGLYGLICFASLLAILLPALWRDSRAGLGMTAPLVFMLVVAVLVRIKLGSQADGLQQAATTIGSHGGPQGREWATQFASQVIAQARASLSIGFGAWLSLLGSLYLAWRGVRQVTDATDNSKAPVAARRLA